MLAYAIWAFLNLVAQLGQISRRKYLTAEAQRTAEIAEARPQS
jgi:hypothetical protein